MTYQQKIDQQIKDFNPNDIVTDRFATYCPSRTPEFKLHRRRRDALSALAGTPGSVWEQEDGVWRWLGTRSAEPKLHCDCCGNTTLVRRSYAGISNRHPTQTGRWVLLRDRRTGKLPSSGPVDAAFVCDVCRLTFVEYGA